MTSEHQTEATLHTWLDNELGSRESAAVQEHVQSCTACSTLLAECRDTRATVSSLLHAYDGTLESRAGRAPQAINSTNRFSGKHKVWRQTLSALETSARIPFHRQQSAPLISHIVASSQPVKFWTGMKTLVPVAVAASLIVGSAALFMARSYHVVVGSVKSFANDTQAPFVDIDGQVLTEEGKAIANAMVSVEGKSAHTVTDSLGNFKLMHVPRSAETLLAYGIGFRRSSMRFTSDDGDVLSVQFRLTRELRVLNPVRITLGDSIEHTKPLSTERRR